MRISLNILLLFIISQHWSVAQESYETSSILKVERAGRINYLKDNKSNWAPQLRSFEASANKSSISNEALNELKRRGRGTEVPPIHQRVQALSPVMNINFEGNGGNGSVPPDNTVAVSDNGFVISSINSNLIFAKSDGHTFFAQSLSDFFKDLGLGAGCFDPRVIFDVEAKRFIIVALSGSSPDISTICVAFSESEDPGLGWNFYKIKGDVLGENLWFDYPNIGITDNDLFISGNMFSNQEGFKYSTIVQMSKLNGYVGGPLSYKFYAKMKEPFSNQTLFNVTPVSDGWDNNAADKMLFLTNDPRGGTDITVLCTIAGKLSDNPEFAISALANGQKYSTAPSVPQRGIADVLQTGDCRIQYAVELNGVIHFILKTKANGLAAIYYGRYIIATNEVFTSIYTEANMHVSYPAIAPFGDSEADSKILIHFLRSNSTIHPEQAAIVVQGERDVFEYSNAVLIREGDSPVNALGTADERWGDYSTACKRFFDNKVEVWVAGCFGRTTYGTWLAQFYKQEEEYFDFQSNETIINPGDTVFVSQIGRDSLNDIAWLIQGGEKLAGFDTLGMVRFDSLGHYDLTLQGHSLTGREIAITKSNYIHVVPKVFPPVSAFTASATTIFEGDTVTFTDLSTNQPTRWKWSFSGGKPSTSTDQNPKITYAKKGQYSVVLTSGNTGGDDAEVKQKYIVVAEKLQAPIADFVANKTEISVGDSVQFTDLSVNKPDAWTWIVESDSVSDTLYVENPWVHFHKAGIYDVSLTAKNNAGQNTIVKENYISILPSSVLQTEWLTTPNLYPNPVVNDRVALTFALNASQILSFKIYKMDGSLVHSLLEKEAKAGRNEFSFNTDMLTNGYYLLSITDVKSNRSKSYPFTINK